MHRIVLPAFRRFSVRLQFVRFSSTLPDPSSVDQSTYTIHSSMKSPVNIVRLMENIGKDPSSANAQITELLGNTRPHHIRYIINNLVSKNLIDESMILLPYFLEQQLLTEKTVIPITQLLAKAWIRKGSSKEISDLAERLRGVLTEDRIVNSLWVLLDTCSNKWPIPDADLDKILFLKNDCFDALVVAALRNSDFEGLDSVLKRFPNRFLHSDPDVFDVFLDFVKSNEEERLTSIYLKHIEGQVVIYDETFQHIQKLVGATKNGKLVESKVVGNACEVCKVPLKKRILSVSEFECLKKGYHLYFHEECKAGRAGIMAEFNAMQGLLREIRSRKNCRSFIVVDGLNVNMGKMEERSGFMTGIRGLRNTYDVVLVILRVDTLTDRMKLLKQHGVDFFTLGRYSDDDLFAIYATMHLGPNVKLVSNDRFVNITVDLKQETDISELFSIWAMNQVIGYSLPLQIHNSHMYSNLLNYSPESKSCHFTTLQPTSIAKKKLFCLTH